MIYLKRMFVLIGLLALFMVLLVGCMYPGENKDPRVGRVYLDEDACDIFNACGGSWKVCVGPDLVFQQATWDSNGADRRIVKNAEECQP